MCRFCAVSAFEAVGHPASESRGELAAPVAALCCGCDGPDPVGFLSLLLGGTASPPLDAADLALLLDVAVDVVVHPAASTSSLR